MVRHALADAGDLPALRALWKRCFEESEQALDCLFAHLPALAHIYKATDGGKLIAAVYLMDCTLCGELAHYLCGVATLPEYRQQGVMTALMEYALGDAKRRGDCCSVLLPANEHLYRYYARLGYERRCTAETVVWTADALPPAATPSGTPDFQAIQSGFDHAVHWSDAFLRFAAQYYGCYGCRQASSDKAFCLYETDNDTAFVFYAVYNTIPDLQALLRTIDARRYVVTGSSGRLPLAKSETCGMLRPLTNDPLPDNVFIGLTLN